MNVILTTSPELMETESPTGHLLSPNKASKEGAGIHPIKLLAKGSMEILKQPNLLSRQ